MATSVCWQVMQSMQRTLQSMSFTPQGRDQCSSIKSQNIVIRKVSAGAKADETKNLANVEKPGIVIVQPKATRRPTNMGDNQLSWVIYPILVQIIDNDSADRVANQETYLKWQQQVARAFDCHDYTDIDASVSCAYSFVQETDTVDEKLWARSPGVMVAAVVVLVYSKETRGIEL